MTSRDDNLSTHVQPAIADVIGDVTGHVHLCTLVGRLQPGRRVYDARGRHTDTVHHVMLNTTSTDRSAINQLHVPYRSVA